MPVATKKRPVKEKPEHLKLLVDKLSTEVKELMGKKDNLEGQVVSAQKRLEMASKHDDVKLQQERNKGLVEIAHARSSLSQERRNIQVHMDALARREEMLQKREAQVKDTQYWLDKLQKERYEIYNKRKEAKEMMEEAQRHMGIISSHSEALKARSDALDGREIAVQDKENRWNDEIGSLEAKQKVLRDWEADIKALEADMNDKTNKEEENGKG